jgi:hypothetical protein
MVPQIHTCRCTVLRTGPDTRQSGWPTPPPALSLELGQCLRSAHSNVGHPSRARSRSSTVSGSETGRASSGGWMLPPSIWRIRATRPVVWSQLIFVETTDLDAWLTAIETVLGPDPSGAETVEAATWRSRL